jgi:cyanophycinase
MKAIDGTGLADVIRERHRAGVTVGGTSAGAAVIADAMFTGEADLKSLTAGATAIARGLGLWPEVLIDQHFLKRQRDNRLISAVLDRPSLVGVGIDEGTAVIVHDGSLDVIGKSSVVIIDARAATVDRAAPGTLVSARDVKLSVLHAGQSYSLKRRTASGETRRTREPHHCEPDREPPIANRERLYNASNSVSMPEAIAVNARYARPSAFCPSTSIR